MSDKVIGIDLGTTNSVLAIIKDGHPVLLPVQGNTLLPSVVGVSPAGDLLVGTPARNQWVVAAERTVRSIKRQMGSNISVMMAGTTYKPQEISAFILREIKTAAEAALRETVHRAVITVPAYFDETQRQATMEAGEIAGLTVERLINEPTAAALAYGYGQAEDKHLRVLVYDLGGGTFDVSVIELNLGVIDVLATSGDNHLGGDDFDARLAGLLADEFEEEHGVDLREQHQAWARLLRAAEEAKIALSSSPFTTVGLEYLAEDDEGRPLHLQREVERAEFEDLVEDLIESTIERIDQALDDAELSPGEIDRVLLVGGTTRIPAVVERVAEHLEQDPHQEIDPDAAVALGAAVQAGIIAGEEIDAVLVDVTPLSLGIDVARIGFTGHVMPDNFKPLIRRNTTVPVQKSEVFWALHPDQTQIEIKVYQGEHAIASENTLLGEFMVENLETNRAGEPAQVTVQFALNVNGILEVTVTDRNTGRQTREQLKASRQRLSPDEIAESQRKLLQSEFAQIGGAAREEADPGLVALVERAERTLSREDLDPDLGEEISEMLRSIREMIAENDLAAAHDYADELIDLLIEAEL